MEGNKRLSVSQLNGYIKSVFDDELILHNIDIYGELNQLSVRDSISYFTITEGGCYINCVMFSAIENIAVGAKVLAGGKISFYPKTGKINFTVKYINVIGQGELQSAYDALKERLRKEGLFENRPKPPIYISSVALITSETGAVLHDILSIIQSKGIHLDLKLYPTAVQGDNAKSTIIDAVKSVNIDKPDVVIIARGGGSNCDLDIFNDEQLARTVSASRVPVISAIGHEVDFTLCDFCSGTRAGTPSIAAEIIADINIELNARLFHALQTINSSIERIYNYNLYDFYYSSVNIVHAMDKRVEQGYLMTHLLKKRLAASIDRQFGYDSEKVKRSIGELDNAVLKLVDDKELRFKNAIGTLEYVNPLKILSRGYCKVVKSGTEISEVEQLEVGDEINLYFRNGSANAKIANIKNTRG